jgi:flagellar basal-body rod modification protein FlgD
MSTSPISSPSALDSASSTSSQSIANSTSGLANQNVFLQLLVAQLKNQDPQNPADGTTFITQLATFSELSNTTQMTSSLTSIQQELASGAPPAATTTPTSKS